MLREWIRGRGERAAEGRLREAFEVEERESLGLAYRARLAAYAAIAIWLTIQFPLASVLYYDAFLVAFAASAYIQWRLRRGPHHAPWQAYAFAFIEAALLTYVVLVPNPFDLIKIPAQITLRFGAFAYFFIFLALAALTYSPRLVVITGASIAACWSAAVLWIASRPESLLPYGWETLHGLSVEETMATLRAFHGRMADAVFAHDGTLDKYMGDAVMATFGTPHRGPRDALDALACARAMTDAIAAWAVRREAEGSAPIAVGIGVHFGPVLLGDIGDERRLEFAVIGDTVNVASRLEALTRTLGARVIVSDALVAAARAELGGTPPGLDDFARVEAQSIRGREGAIGIWALGVG